MSSKVVTQTVAKKANYNHKATNIEKTFPYILSSAIVITFLVLAILVISHGAALPIVMVLMHHVPKYAFFGISMGAMFIVFGVAFLFFPPHKMVSALRDVLDAIEKLSPPHANSESFELADMR